MSDELILTLLHDGDMEAYKQLFIKYYSPLTEYASQYISDEDAEELVQELMLFIWEYRKTIYVEGALKSYLFTATKNRCLNAIKKQQYHQRIHGIIYEKLKEKFEDPNFYMVNDLSENIQKAIHNLPEKQREVFVLSRFGNHTNVQIANKLGISVKTVEYRISQALRILRIRLKDYFTLLFF
ncbi:RNA polymerase sigma-70 factor (family 1) [Parabacteroides sp. PF5-5]|uniref:RNA polymerase sigma-70 factor n=1 Tax=unclassified Parabacteroides TaxID=2649774 RepID=UPI002475EAE9|nr:MULTISPECIES: RNA polymerase sigma-70 factor [unclassified Parabacteroides]MDH6305450.1 RNA polymerase sigma-70 factor (family 1) [Parabacteroides sp. PH5-39]MDH6316160.1 RNA polymerase sigma-70 factor (family 1) [Parabacteroides sp. PF5-13]MDH6320310.1 RNA polymerase sigma-70 factor (family 1) [Parabacteroides sp. PH5-13]MDH6324040.1 RNA polymerase sigma-70 factor (family 1) [Parabacteroides sp. PH5-8]MDH6327351.1 RNA polymerase sigma-70 factor (family 1) [Parabacteroides sp. PH5-41]